MFAKSTRITAFLLALGTVALGTAAPAEAQYRQKIGNDMAQCRAGSGPAALVTVSGITGGGKVRVQAYRATSGDWLKSGRWLNRIEAPARPGTMTFCVPLPQSGSYAIAVRHDVNGNGKTDLSSDGGGMSNNPSINIFNLGKPGVDKASFAVGNGPKAISIRMRYM
ncbi:DUF2141 domain-containing protein [Altererythrobacter aerius]|uniref:DUF2141 domain-containing protein n=1 Tax=Tsuneonella aeria TaxID=1837929 RepID=A0A6I4TGX2_9SPHN|nr:DUF2141 domain-containing protein [Tsuneonella aeria]MXO75325.1 DUF2141 domain-containing protein [Tsuneonella aeria]